MLLEAARGDRLEALYVLAIHTGMRQGELLALKWEDVDLDAAVLRVRGTKTARSAAPCGSPRRP
jgi:integrase